MKPFIGMLVAVSLLVGCSGTPIHPSATPTSTSTEAPTPTLTLTLTPIPSATPTPGLPQTVQIEIDKVIPENIVNLVKNTVNQAYWFYVKMGCSPDFHHVQIVGHESALTIGTDAVLIGWDDLTTISPNMDVRISHEMAHVMCQIDIKKDPDGTGLELMWLLEGMANYFADNERLIDTGRLSGWQGNVLDHQVGLGEWIVEKRYCNYPFQSVEKDTRRLGVDYPDYPGVGEVAATLLANTSSEGTQALISYYRYLANETSDSAFEKAFGRTKDAFYQQFTQECLGNFPSLGVLTPPFDKAVAIDALYTPTAIPSQEVGIIATGMLILQDKTQKFTDFEVTFCNTQSDQCLPGTSVLSAGNFSVYLPVGNYRVGINSITNGKILGWYTKDGLVADPTCAKVITVDVKHELDIAINLQGKSC